jgi:hypothetical protein
MKTARLPLAAIIAAWGSLCLAETSSFPSFLGAIAQSDIIGLGTFGGDGPEGGRINNITYWLGDAGTNSVMLTVVDRTDGPVLPNAIGTNETVVFFGTRLGWNPLPPSVVLHSNSSAWELRVSLAQAGSAGSMPPDPFRFPGDWFKIPTNSTATVSFVSNVVQSLCVATNLIQYGHSLVPALEADADDDLFLFKADVHMELLRLEWNESESFLTQVLNDPQYPRQIRGHALFQLKKRFGWPEDSTIPEP